VKIDDDLPIIGAALFECRAIAFFTYFLTLYVLLILLCFAVPAQCFIFMIHLLS